MTISSLSELFLHELKDVYDAENQLIEALPRLEQAATNPKLAEAFRRHLEQTREHVNRLEEVFAACGAKPERKTCRGMKGLLDEAERLLKEDLEPAVQDAGLIGAAQRVEHYEIAAYGTLKVWAATAGLEEVMENLEATLEEEKAADDKLTEIAQMGVNRRAGTQRGSTADAEYDEVEEGGEEEAPARPKTSGSKSRTQSRSRAKRPAISRSGRR